MEVYEKKQIPVNCATCLYFVGTHCGHADRKDDWARYALMGVLTGHTTCPDYYLNHHKYIVTPPQI